MIILATDRIDSLKDENGNALALLNCEVKSKNRVVLLWISADLAEYLYLSKTAVYYTAATCYQYKGKTISQDYYDRLISPDMYGNSESAIRLFDTIEIYADDFPDLRLEEEAEWSTKYHQVKQTSSQLLTVGRLIKNFLMVLNQSSDKVI